MSDGTPPAQLHQPSGAILAVSTGMPLVPFPGGKNDLPDITRTGRPAQFPADLFRRCNQYPWVTRSTTYDFMGDWAADSFLAGAEYLEYRHASSRAHIDCRFCPCPAPRIRRLAGAPGQDPPYERSRARRFRRWWGNHLRR